MKVYGITEIARALGVDPVLVSKWRERSKLPPADAELSFGPVWLAESIEPFLEEGGPEPKSPGLRHKKYAVSATMLAGSYPPVTAKHRKRFTSSIHQLYSRGLLSPEVEWQGQDRAHVRIGCVASSPQEAARVTSTIIMRRAQFDAQIGVRDVDIVDVEALGDWPA